ncbi:MAG: hypothetical protein H0U73_00780 [Tatlockia sp.]|nr:hypothetical protein [Tatlockia sp.]
MNQVNLSNIIDAVEFQSDENFSYIDKRTNTICLISEEAFSLAKDGDDDYPEWMDEMVQLAKSYLEDDTNFISLPSRYDVNEYRMMENFAFSLNNERQKENLLIALQGKGAFRRFIDTVNYLGIADNWYQYRDKQYKEFVQEWCEMEGIKIEQGCPTKSLTNT